jgi:hypothetical protein
MLELIQSSPPAKPMLLRDEVTSGEREFRRDVS